MTTEIPWPYDLLYSTFALINKTLKGARVSDKQLMLLSNSLSFVCSLTDYQIIIIINLVTYTPIF